MLPAVVYNTENIFVLLLSKLTERPMNVRRPAFHGRSHACGAGIPRRVGLRDQGPRGSWSIGVKLGADLKGSEIDI